MTATPPCRIVATHDGWEVAMALEKRPLAKVRDIETARSRGGRPAGRGYDPATGEEIPPTGGEPELPESSDARGAKADYDVFGLVDSNTYRHDRFYTRSVDRHHHGEKMSLRVPQGIDAQMYAAVNQVPFYRHVNDLVRDAIIHRLEWLQHHFDLDDSVRRLAELERFNADSIRRAQEIEVMSATVADLNERLRGCWEAEDWQMFALEIDQGDARAEWLREPYRSKAMNVLKEWRTRAKRQLAALDEER